MAYYMYMYVHIYVHNYAYLGYQADRTNTLAMDEENLHGSRGRRAFTIPYFIMWHSSQALACMKKGLEAMYIAFLLNSRMQL